MKKILLAGICLLLWSAMHSQSAGPWNGRPCAVVITYDDAIDQHLDNARPVLDSLGLRATFYITAYSNSVKRRMNEWRKLAMEGHELGNHTLYHPCLGGPGREWVPADYDMRNYSVRRMVDETRMTNVFLEALDGRTRRTFAFTCGDMKIGDSSFINAMKDDFVAARAVRHEMHGLGKIDLYNVDCYGVNGETGQQLIAWAKQAISSHSLLVVLFHGVGGGNALNVTVAAHREFLQFLKAHPDEIWVAPLIEIADYVKSKQ